MIIFKNINKTLPYKIFKNKYEEALNANQENIDAICISSYSKTSDEVNSRFVNLKFIENNKFIFFSNYSSPKSHEFHEHNQISAIIFWSKINTQIRIKANIMKTSENYNQQYFINRSYKKNALSISSKQSDSILSYEKVIDNYEDVIKNKDLNKCPKYWGGYSFVPYYFEFWEGHKSRLNKRIAFSYQSNNKWNKTYLQP